MQKTILQQVATLIGKMAKSLAPRVHRHTMDHFEDLEEFLNGKAKFMFTVDDTVSTMTTVNINPWTQAPDAPTALLQRVTVAWLDHFPMARAINIGGAEAMAELHLTRRIRYTGLSPETGHILTPDEDPQGTLLEWQGEEVKETTRGAIYAESLRFDTAYAGSVKKINTNLTTVDLAGCASLKSVTIYNTPNLVDIQGLERQTALATLCIDGAAMGWDGLRRRLPPEETLRRMGHVEITSMHMEEQPEWLRGHETLRSLWLWNNALTSFAGSFPDIRELRLENNALTSFAGEFPALYTLWLWNNALTSFAGSFPALNTLWLWNNALTSFAGSFPDIRELRLENNALTSFAGEFPALYTLRLENNALTSFAGSFPALYTLWLENNALASFAGEFNALRELRLQNNALTSFAGEFPALNTLYLDNNPLSGDDPLADLSAPQLVTINLSTAGVNKSIKSGYPHCVDLRRLPMLRSVGGTGGVWDCRRFIVGLDQNITYTETGFDAGASTSFTNVWDHYNTSGIMLYRQDGAGSGMPAKYWCYRHGTQEDPSDGQTKEGYWSWDRLTWLGSRMPPIASVRSLNGCAIYYLSLEAEDIGAPENIASGWDPDTGWHDKNQV